MPRDLIQKLKNVSLLAMDFDGVHTDGFVYVDDSGHESVRCSRRDSLGLNMLKRAGVKLFVISKEKNPVVLARCNKLDIECYQGIESGIGKKEILASLIERENVSIENVVFIGDDVNDVDAISYAGIGVTVADGHEKVKQVADVILTRNGGNHALRELCDLILDAKGLPIAY